LQDETPPLLVDWTTDQRSLPCQATCADNAECWCRKPKSMRSNAEHIDSAARVSIAAAPLSCSR